MLGPVVKSAVLFVVLVILFEPAVSISCYQCTSTDTDNPYLCTEFMTEDEDIQPKPCDDTYDAKYCIKFTGRDEEGLKTKRFCSSLDRGTYCVYGSQTGDRLDYRSCWYTCSTDGCNSATRIGTENFLYSLVLGLLSKVFIEYIFY
ncbi:hypothetical protein J437_LFUL001740 [Ladona fulva]|uniref:Protein sleepless n=1 Tax=Ladona fulva TaxID=123851 RepID=A0A8K0JZT4_LADFU|nr:hypothetical protein J437_LFUL001740 [Ladona fulva]